MSQTGNGHERWSEEQSACNGGMLHDLGERDFHGFWGMGESFAAQWPKILNS